MQAFLLGQTRLVAAKNRPSGSPTALKNRREEHRTTRPSPRPRRFLSCRGKTVRFVAFFSKGSRRMSAALAAAAAGLAPPGRPDSPLDTSKAVQSSIYSFFTAPPPSQNSRRRAAIAPSSQLARCAQLPSKCLTGARSKAIKKKNVENNGVSPDNEKTRLNPTYAHTQGVSGVAGSRDVVWDAAVRRLGCMYCCAPVKALCQ